jgi:predicted TIM-barrel enzyme
MIGTTKSLSLEDSAALTKKIIAAGKDKRKDILWLAHGGPLSTPESFRKFLALLPGIDGFVGASSMERIPTEQAIAETVREFKEISQPSGFGG